MKKAFLVIVLAALATLSGVLMSKMSWIGRLGISLVHREYSFLKVWWQGALVVFGVYLVLLLLHQIVDSLLGKPIAKFFHALFLLAAIAGLYATYTDFASDFTHKILKEHFHLGAYMFWVGWITVALFYLFKRTATTEINKKAEVGL